MFQASLTAITHCPQSCRCDNMEGMIDCSNVSYHTSKPSQSSQHLLTLHSAQLKSVRTLRLDNSSHIEGVLLGEVFANMTQLRQLYVTRNHITHIAPDAFVTLVNLQKLDISHNDVSQISQGYFQNVTSLEHLNLSFNNISSIALGSFDSLTDLTELDMSNNPLKHLPKYIFRNLTKLEYLSFSHTLISTLHSSYFSYSPNLITVDASYNRIAKIGKMSVKALSVLENLQVFDISNNSLRCDCRLIEFRNWLEDSNITTSATCGKPFHQRQYVMNLTLSKLTCPPKLAKKTTVPHPKVKATEGPLVYNPQLGWYTGGVLSTMLVIFLICVCLDKLKRFLVRLYKQKKAEHRKRNCENGDGENEVDLESLNSCPNSTISPAAVAAAFHEQYLSVITYNQQLKSNLSSLQHSQTDIPSCRGDEFDRPTDELAKDNTVTKNLIDANTLSQEKIAVKQRIDAGPSRSPRHTDLSLPRVSTSYYDDNDDDTAGMTVLEVHPECPIHNATNSRLFKAQDVF